MTNSYAIIRAIAQIQGMSYAEKFAGAMLALHLDRKKNQIVVKQSALAKECGLTVRSIRGAIAKIVRAGVLTSVRKSHGLTLIPQLPLEEESVLKIERNSRSYQMGTAVPITGYKMPWD